MDSYGIILGGMSWTWKCKENV